MKTIEVPDNYREITVEIAIQLFQELRRVFGLLVEWVCKHDLLEVKNERRALLGYLWEAKDAVGRLAYVLEMRVINEDDQP